MPNRNAIYKVWDVDILNEFAVRSGYQAQYTQLTRGDLQVAVCQHNRDDWGYNRKAVFGSVECIGVPGAGLCSFILIKDPSKTRLHRHDASSASLYFVPQNQEVEIVTQPGAFMLTASVAQTKISDILRAHRLGDTVPIPRHAGPLDVSDRHIERANQLFDKFGSDDEAVLTHRLDDFFIEALVAHSQRSLDFNASLLNRRQQFGRLRNYILQNLSHQIKSNAMCDVLDLSERSLQRLVYAETGLSPSDYVKALRLEHVRQALVQSEGPNRRITDLALESGFSHLGRFPSIFREHFGILPSQVLPYR
ncbi:helix-turn-helix domain-containing protein [Roseibium sp.]|uniref:AraC family transcriptional regulator n=1 Tax=Roseibium sp. TaxID=1936156 RepID=UPI003D14D0AA